MEAAGGGVDVRTRQMLAENRANSANLRDLLRIKQEDNNNRSNVSSNNNLVGLTLGAVLNGDMRSMSMPVQPNRTLFDIIRDEPVGKNSKDGKKSWKLLKKKLNLRRAGSGSAWTSSTPIPASDVGLYQNNTNRFMTRRHSIGLMSNTGGSTQLPEAEASSSSSVVTRSSDVMLQRNMSQAADRRTAEEEEKGESSEVAAEGGEEQPVRMSLMALLEETDRQMGLDGSGLLMGDSEEDENEDMNVNVDVDVDVDIDGGREGGYNSCCVCMVRHKGAAFIPCGHTFCRLCSRELWVQRGNCPLCNNFIKEILDIF